MVPASKRSVPCCFRLRHDHLALLETVGADHACEKSQALSIVLAVAAGKPRPAIIRPGVVTPVGLCGIETHAPQLYADLDRLVPRLNNPLPRSRDPHLTDLVVKWRREIDLLLPSVEAFCRTFQEVHLALLGGYELDQNQLFAAAEQWTEMSASAMNDEPAQENHGSTNLPKADNSVSRSKLRSDRFVPIWNLLFCAGIAKKTSPVWVEDGSHENLPLLNFFSASSQAISKHGPCDAPCDAAARKPQLSVRITTTEDRFIRTVKRTHRCTSRTEAVELIVDAFIASSKPIRLDTRVASVGDLDRARRIGEYLLARFDAAQSRLRAPVFAQNDQQLTEQIEQWDQVLQRFRPRIARAVAGIRCVRNVLRAVERADVTRLQAAITEWVGALPAALKAQRLTQRHFDPRTSAASDRPLVDYRKFLVLWEVLHLAGLTAEPPTVV